MGQCSQESLQSWLRRHGKDEQFFMGNMGRVRSLQSFRPVQTQTMLYSHRRQIEALNLGSSGIVLSADDLCLCFAYAKSRFYHDAAHMREKRIKPFC